MYISSNLDGSKKYVVTYEFRIVLPSPAGLPPEEVRRRFHASSERQARKLASEWAGPNATVGECCGCWSRN